MPDVARPAYELELERAHLFMVRRDYAQARTILVRLSAQFPGQPDVLRMLADVESRMGVRRAPRRPLRLPRQGALMGAAALLGIFALWNGLWLALAIRFPDARHGATISYGFRTYSHFHVSVPVATAIVAVAAVCAIGCLTAAVVREARTRPTP